MIWALVAIISLLFVLTVFVHAILANLNSFFERMDIFLSTPLPGGDSKDAV
jgi:hypothetical protein